MRLSSTLTGYYLRAIIRVGFNPTIFFKEFLDLKLTLVFVGLIIFDGYE